MMGGHEAMMNGGYGSMGLWMGFWLLVVAVVIAGAIFAAVKLAIPRRESNDEALQLLRQRYASGDIDADEYAARQLGLGGSH